MTRRSAMGDGVEVDLDVSGERYLGCLARHCGHIAVDGAPQNQFAVTKQPLMLSYTRWPQSICLVRLRLVPVDLLEWVNSRKSVWCN